jgi:RNA methyltransferase, TrmH family
MTIRHISSKSNPWFKKIKELASANKAYREHRQIWLEGEHLCRAAIARGWRLNEVVINETTFSKGIDFWEPHASTITVLPDSLMSSLSALPSSTWISAVVDLPDSLEFNPHISTVVLDQLQDPGNVGSILRSAAAFGFKQVVTTPQSVALWSSKVIRAAMGAHFGIQLIESVAVSSLLVTELPVLVTSSHQGQALHDLVHGHALPSPCVWVFGHEGQGASLEWFDKAFLKIRIEQPGGEESLNVAAAAAICLHASVRTV